MGEVVMAKSKIAQENQVLIVGRTDFSRDLNFHPANHDHGDPSHERPS